jgi:hypothetical protein
MMSTVHRTRRPRYGGRATAAVALAVAAVGIAGCGGSGSSATSRQDEVEARGARVMPFDQERTTHVFRNTATGGVQRVVTKAAHDARQLRLVRAHLRTEAARFTRGDFTDPMAIHGMEMPGLATLRRGAARVTVEYSDLPRGAQIDYRTAEPALVAALHEWFDAQLMDHGANAHG